MSTASTHHHSSAAAHHLVAKRNIIVLVIAQAFLGAQLPMITVLAGIAGLSLAPDAIWSTLPIAVMGLGATTTSAWISQIMQRYGRRTGFMLGVLGGAVGAALSGYGLMVASFTLFVCGSYFTGIYMAAHGFYRFAAMDAVPKKYRSKAMSYVMAGGLIAAILGTQTSKVTSDMMVVPFMGTYFAVVAINLIGIIIFQFLKDTETDAQLDTARNGRSRLQMLADPYFLRAIICASLSTGIMAFVMASTPFAIIGFGCGHDAATDVVMAHVLAMFVPCFFTGHVILRFGAEKVVASGFVFLASAAMINLLGTELPNFYTALVLLGMGWNFGFIGATAMLGKSHARHEKGRAQGLNDMIVCGVSTVASLAAGAMMNQSGSSLNHSWDTVNLGIFPILAIAMLALALPRLHALTAKPWHQIAA